jgi:methyl-accepting chemotaxis protein
MSTLTPLLKVSLALLFLLAVATGVYLPKALSQAEEETYAKLANDLTHDLGNEERLIENIGVTNAIFIAENKRIKAALANNDRSTAIDELETIFEKFRKSTRITELKVHIHTADLKSFIRSWKRNKFGDDLSGFRKTIVRVKETLQPVFNFEVGRIGLTLRSIVPILEGERYLGSLEFMQSFDNVPKHFEKRGNQHLLLMHESLVSIATDLKDAQNVGQYKLCSKTSNPEFLKAAQKLDLDRLQATGYAFTDQYFFTYKPINDMENNTVGMHLLGMASQQVQRSIAEAKHSVLTLIAITLFSFLLIVFFVIVVKTTWSSKSK